MLAVVLVPIVLMLVACLLERLEATAVPADSPRPAPRAQRPGAVTAPATTSATTSGVVPAEAPARHLALVPVAPAVAEEKAEDLPRAS